MTTAQSLRWSCLGAAVLIACEGAAPGDSVAQTLPPPAPPPATSPRTGTEASRQIDASRRTAITEATARVAPAVVTVQTETIERVPVDIFGMFFGGAQQRVAPGIGSGFIIRENGVVVTNAHVVSNASNISVMMRDGTTYPARLLGEDETNDLAVLKIDASGLPVAPLGNSDDLVIGEWAIAIGNPFGFVLANSEPSVTTGVISATGRNLLGGAEGSGLYVDMIQTDASINPGNSGGPLVNGAGEVIGVNSSIYTPSRGSVGLGFAIPINRARRVAEDLIEHGKIRRPWVGELLRTSATSNPRDVINAGAILRAVVPGSPAAAAGLRADDQILRAGTRRVRNAFDWEAARLSLRVGDRVPLLIRRGDREITVTVTVADRPEVSAPKVTVLREIELTTLTPTLRAERGIRSAQGALVTNVSQLVRDEIGLDVGDVILQINSTPIRSADDVARAVNQARPRTVIRVAFERRGVNYYSDFVIR
ncbi:MAG TPA: trypsin-like peptidase domain-containing protein [Gemmatimonadaceae bacterium]